MVDSFAFANKGIIRVTGKSNSFGGGAVPTILTLGVVKDVELTPSAEHVPLYGWGSIARQAVAKHSAKVTVKVGYVKIDPVYTTGWQFFILDPAAAATANGKFASGTADTNLVKTFDIDAWFVFESGVSLHGKVYDVYFPSFPMKAAEGQWVKCDMTGDGAYVIFDNVAA